VRPDLRRVAVSFLLSKPPPLPHTSPLTAHIPRCCRRLCSSGLFRFRLGLFRTPYNSRLYTEEGVDFEGFGGIAEQEPGFQTSDDVPPIAGPVGLRCI